jgi:transcriptional regulator with XRE-family HTH domain
MQGIAGPNSMSLVEKRLGQKVAEFRQQARLTQAELAEKVGVATETISRLERGAAVPSLARLEEIASALALELPELFTFRVRGSRREKALDGLVAALRQRSAEDLDMLADIARCIFERLQVAKRAPARTEGDRSPRAK